MTTLRTTLLALGFMSLGAIGTLGLQATAGPGYERGGMHERGGGDHGLRALGYAMSRLDLSDEQQAALEGAQEDIRTRMDEAREGMEDERDAMRQALVDGTLERKDVKARIKERMGQAEELMLYAVDRVFDVYETLDEDQRAELVQLLDEMASRHEAMSGRRGGHHGGRPGGGLGGELPDDSDAERDAED